MAQSREIVKQRALIVVKRLREDAATRPMPAIKLASFLGLRTKDHEALRRRVREAVTYAREVLGERICANDCGVWPMRPASSAINNCDTS